MVHLINPRVNHQAHSIHSFEGLAEDTTLVHLRGSTAHLSPRAVSGDTELSCCLDGVAGGSTALPAAGPFPGPTTSQIPHQASHSLWMKCAFSLGTVLVFRKSSMEISMRDHVKLRQNPGSSSTHGQERGLLPSLLMALEGWCAELLFGLCWAGSSHQSTLASHQCGKWHVAWPGLSLQHTPWPWDEQDARGAMSAAGSLCHASFGEHGSCNKSIIQRALAGAQQKMRTSCKLWHWWPGEQQGESTPPCHFASSQHTAWCGRTDQEPSLH